MASVSRRGKTAYADGMKNITRRGRGVNVTTTKKIVTTKTSNKAPKEKVDKQISRRGKTANVLKKIRSFK
jgi:hypothetical protein